MMLELSCGTGVIGRPNMGLPTGMIPNDGAGTDILFPVPPGILVIVAGRECPLVGQTFPDRPSREGR